MKMADDEKVQKYKCFPFFFLLLLLSCYVVDGDLKIVVVLLCHFKV